MSSARSRRFRPGLRARLTLWTTAVLATSLGLGFVWVDHALRAILEARNDAFLESKAVEFSSFTDRESSAEGDESLRAEARREVAALGESGLIVILRRPGSVSVFPPTTEARRLEARLREPSGRDGHRTVDFDGGSSYRVARVGPEQEGSPGVMVDVALSLAETDATLAQFDRRVAAGWLAFLALAFVGGLWLSRQALRPVARSIAAARRLNPSDFSARLPRSGVGDELDLLAGTVNDLLERLGSYHAQITRFTADASHELRGPLAAIRAAVEVALAQPRTAEAYRETLVTLGERCDRLTALVNGLLLLARADAGEVELRREPVDLAAIAVEVAEMFQPIAEERGIALRWEAPGPTRALGDPTRLAQLATNLVDNAIKFTEPGGSVLIRVEKARDRARLVVSDTGIGIPADRLPHVFERFSQVDPSRSSKGSGLGLSICRWIAEAHGGTIAVVSETGRGSAFTALLPVPDRGSQI